MIPANQKFKETIVSSVLTFEILRRHAYKGKKDKNQKENKMIMKLSHLSTFPPKSSKMTVY